MTRDSASRIKSASAAIGLMGVLGDAMPVAMATEPVPGVPAVRRYGPVTHVSGGIDDREILAIRTIEMAHPLVLDFAEPGSASGDTLYGVVVDIRDSAGWIVLNPVTDGPLLFVDVPTGKYLVTAGYSGNAQQLAVVVGSRATARRYASWSASRSAIASLQHGMGVQGSSRPPELRVRQHCKLPSRPSPEAVMLPDFPHGMPSSVQT